MLAGTRPGRDLLDLLPGRVAVDAAWQIMTVAEKLLCAIIRGDVTSWPGHGRCRVEQVLSAAFTHNVHLILFYILKKLDRWRDWPLRLRETLEREYVAACALDLIHERELRRVLTGLDRHGLRPILLKGVPLAYTLYASPALRPRTDVDLLIKEDDAEQVTRVLGKLGYDGADIERDKLTNYQCLFRRQGQFGACHSLDVHWKVNNAQLFAQVLTYDELLAEACELPTLASCARGSGHKHALLLACMHRFGHAHAPFYIDGEAIYAGDHLRWVYDIHLLSSTLNAAQWLDFVALAIVKRMAGFCLDGLNAAREAFNTQVPPEVTGALQTAARDEARSTQKLRTSTTAWFFTNLRALPTLRERLELIRQVVLPSPGYMMEKYQTHTWLALPFLYGYRSINGIVKRRKWSRFRL